MAKKLKCSMCKQMFNKEELITKSNKRYCNKCLVIRNEKMEQKRKDWSLLFDYICKLHNIKKPTGMMFKQLKTYRDENNYTDIGMYYTLKYYYETLENSVLEDSGVGIIPYYYEKAKKHYNQIFDIEELAESFEFESEKRIVKTKIHDKKRQDNNFIPLNIVRKEEEDEDSN